MNTGIPVDESIAAEYTALRMKRSHRYLIMRVAEDKSKVEIEHIGARDSTFAEFKELMPKDQCRYVKNHFF